MAEKAGTFLTWEGRTRPFAAALTGTDALPDHRILGALAEEMGTWFGLADVESFRRELEQIADLPMPIPPTSARADARPHAAMASRADRSAGETPSSGAAAESAEGMSGSGPAAGQAVLATWRMLLDSGRMQDWEPHLAGTARTPVARLSAATALEIGVEGGGPVTVSTDRGSITLPCVVTEMPDRVVWLPQNSPGSAVNTALAAAAGDLVQIAAGDARWPAPTEVTS